jgi:arsenate reductase
VSGPIRVLFICTHNSARSQMAEGWLRHLTGDRFEVHSAGTEATRVRPLAIRAMAEEGVDIGGQASKTLERYLAEPWDYVVTVCDDANEACPLFPAGKERLHWSFPDPMRATGTEEEQLALYRTVRDAIRARIDRLVAGDQSTSAVPGRLEPGGPEGRLTAAQSPSSDEVTRAIADGRPGDPGGLAPGQ